MRIAIVGAGFAGLSSAKVLREFGFEVVVYEKVPDVGGVWSATRRYPGLTTQNNKGTYALSDLPMPRRYPEWPRGDQVQAYLERYVEKFGLRPFLRLNTEVVEAVPSSDKPGWEVTARTANGQLAVDHFDHLVVANGIFSVPFVPSFPGIEEFEDAGGQVLAAGEVHNVAEAKGKDVVVIGYGKSSCDIAVPLSEVAASTTVVARHLLWKMPKKLGGVLNYKYLMLTRMGEGLFKYIKPHGLERFLHGPGNPVRKRMLGSVQSVATKQLKLRELDLVPNGGFEDIARSTVSLATDGFYERVSAGRITVLRDRVVARLGERNGRPNVELDDGTVVPAELVVCGTGFRQVVPFFSQEIRDQLTDERGNFQLYRQIHPLRVPNLTFAGYNSSFFSPLSAEMAALWIASLLLGLHALPPLAEREAGVNERLRWMEERTDGHHARGTNIIPFSLHNIDEVLNDLDLNVGPATRAAQWLGPVHPKAYRAATTELKARMAERASSLVAG